MILSIKVIQDQSESNSERGKDQNLYGGGGADPVAR